MTRKMLFLIPLLFLVACSSTVYVCYDGTQVERQRECPTLPTTSLNKMQAERAVDNFANAYARAKQAQISRVNTYYNESGNYYSEILFSIPKNETVSRIKLSVGGQTGTVRCVEGCSILE
jgi:ABC-type sugar transport system ATPase subunit